MKTFLTSKVPLLFALSLFAGAQESSAATFQNGSFESPALSPGAGISMSAGSGVLTGWTVSGPGLVGLGNGSTAVSAVSPVDGSQQVAFNAGDTTPGASISQTFNTVIGQSYRVSFYVGRTGPGNGALGLLAKVTAGTSEVLGSLSVIPPATAGYGPAQSFTFTATSWNSTLTFTDTSSATTALDLLLDNITATEVASPEPHAFTNGSFEQPTLDTPPGILLPSGSTNITGWVTGGPGEVSFVLGPASGVPPTHGSQQIDFNGGNTAAGATLSQEFDTVPGQTYAVSFQVGRAGPGSGTMSLLAAVTSGTGVVLGSLNAVAPGSPGYGSTQTLTFTATTSSSTLTFTDTSSATVAVDLLLDNVSVQASPPPVGPFVNGSFESPTLSVGAGRSLSAGSTAISGWTVGGTGLVGWQNGNVYGINPVDGFQHVGFNVGDTSPGATIFQTFSTAVGQTYVVSFSLGRTGSGSGTMSLLAEVTSSAGTSLGSLTTAAPGTPGYGSTRTFTFTATTAISTLTFTDTSSATVAVDLLLDNVSVQASSPPVGPFVNGSFESPALAPDASVDLPAGSTFITGWTVGNTGLVSWRNGPAYGVVPVDGSQEVGFNGADTPPGGSISQTFSTIIGQAYEVRFNVGRQGSGSGTMNLLAELKSGNGAVLGSLNAAAPGSPGYGSSLTFTFTATTTTSTLTFTDTSSATIAVDLLLDNVRVESGTGSCVTPASGLVHWWPGQSNANDVVGVNDGTLQNGSSFAAGKVGQAFSFDGVDDSVSFGNTVGNFDTNDFTIDFWIRTTSTRLESVIEKWPICGVSSMWNIRIGGLGPGIPFPGHLNTEMSSDTAGNDHNVLVSGRAINDGVFHHVALVRSGTNITYYIDGVLDVSSASAGGVTRINNDANLVAGRSVCVGIDGTSPFTGEMDEISIYNRALSASEIQTIFNAGTAGKCAPTTPQTTAIAHWKFDETGGSTAHDTAGPFDGTLSSGGASFVAGGVSGNALRLNKGTNGFVNMGNVLGLPGDFSIVSWVKTNPGDTTEGSAVVGKHAADYVNGYFLMLNNSGGYGAPGKAFFYNSSFPGQEVTSTSSVNDGQWHQIVAVYKSGGSALIYVDGAPAEASKASRPIVANGVSFLVGGVNFNGVPTGLFTGLVDDVQIYGVALSPTNVDFLFHNPGKEVPTDDLPARRWQLTTSAGAGGTISRDPDLAEYTDGATVTLTANANAGFVFAGWNGDAGGTANPITITMTGNKTVTASFQSVPVGRALAHWKFDETSGTVAHDSAGPFNGNLSPSGASFVSGGASGNALSLSWASNGFVNMGPVLGLETGDFSMVSWVKVPAGDTTDSTIALSRHVAGYANGYLIGLNTSITYGSAGKAYFYDSVFPGQEVTSTSSINDGNWHQIVAVYETGGSKSIYVDGVPVEASNVSHPIVANSAPFLVGAVVRNGAPVGAFTGLIDDVQIYNYALRPSDVDLLFQNPGQEIPPHDLPPGQWRLTAIAGSGGVVTKNPDLSKYTNGASVTMTAVPNPGFAFTGWSGDATGTNNPITVTMNGNKTVTASFAEIPARILAVVNPAPKQEGQKINFDLQLISQGDVGGMNFILRYNPDYLKDPKLEWSSSVGSALNQVNYDAAGEIRATFALPATAVPAGTQRVANVSFRARSVPFDLNTDLGLELVDVSAPTGDPIRTGNAARGGAAHILVRHIVGDNNANDRLDVGDATIMQRLLTGLDQVRSWDVSGNDVNANTTLDSGDVIRVLRVVADIDPQSSPQGSISSTSRLSKSGVGKAGPSSELAVLNADRLRGQPGDLVTVQVVLRDITSQIAGVSFTLDYPTNALRLLNSQSQRTGVLVPGSAVTIWNVQPAQNSYTLQNGRVSFGTSSATQWPSSNGVLAEFVFQVQAGQTEQYRWPVRLSRVELTPDGYEIRDLSESEIYFIGRDPLPASLRTAGSSLSDAGFSFTVGGEIGVPYLIEVSTDLINWTPLTTQINATGVLNVVDPDAPSYSQRFYRAKQQ